MPKNRIVTHLHMKVDTLPELMAALHLLEHREVVVGFPEDKNKPRKNGDPMNNATIAYIQTNGAAAAGIPPRPFLAEGVRENPNKIVAQMKGAGVYALRGDSTGVMKSLTSAGLEGQTAVRRKISEGPFQPLAASTIRRRRTRKVAPRMGTKPLMDTDQLLNAVNFAVREI